MKITCQSCQAKYTIADEKVAGKTVKIRCKKCSATIVVQGDQSPASEGRAPAHTMDPSLVMGQGQGPDEDVATRVFGGDPGGGGAPSGDEWTVNVSETDQRTMTTPQVVMEYQRGTLTNDTYVWKDGMGDWVPITEVAELMQLVSATAGQGSAPVETPAMGLGGTLAMDQPVMSPFAAAARAAPAAAKKPGRAGAVDLFGTQAGAAAEPAGGGGAPGDRQVGERNENSVLFSLSALTGAENAARAQIERDVRAPAPGAPRNNGGRAAMDDIMNLGGGMAAPMLAPPPLLAPVVEAPPPPAPISMGPPGGMGSYAPAMQMPMQQPKSRTGLFIAIAIAVVGLGGIAAFVVTRPAATTASTDGAATTATTASAPSGATPQPSASASAATGASASAAPSSEAAAPSAVAAAESAAPAAAGAQPAGHGGPVPGHGPGRDDKKDDKKADKKDDKKTAAAEPPKEEKKEDKKAEPAGGGGEFDRAAAMSALGAASGGARGCAKPDGPTGGGRVKVTFAPSGHVTSATIEGPPFAGTPVGGCVASMFRGAHVPPFGGSPVVVTKSFTIN